MRLTYKTRSQITWLAITAICVAAACGCRSRGASFPNLSDLAWWKKDDIRLAAPPPSTHFEPEPAVEMQANRIAESGEELADNLKSSTSELMEGVDKFASKPIRKPYSFDEFDADDARKAAERTTEDLKTHLPTWDSSKVASSANEGLDKIQNSLDNSFKATRDSLARKSDEFDNSWKNDFALPAKKSFAGLEMARKSVNQNLNDAKIDHGSFAQRVQKALDKQNDPINEGLAAASEKANQFAADTSSNFEAGMNNQFQAANAASQNVANHVNQSLGQFQGQLDERQAQDNVQQFADNAFQRPGSTSQNPVNRANNIAQQFEQGLNDFQQSAVSQVRQAARNVEDFGNSTARLSGDFEKVAQGSHARLNVPGLNQSSKPNFQTGSSSMTVQQPSQSQSDYQRVAQAGGVPFNSLRPLRNPSSPRSVPSIQNDTPAMQPQFVPAQMQPASEGGYPSTPHEQFNPRGGVSHFQPGSTGQPAPKSFEGQQVGFNQESPASRVATAEGQFDVPDLKSNDVIVPDAIITGSGSFAPGSVSHLTPKQ